MSDYKIEKTYSNNPFVDALLYYTKVLAFGSVTKNMQIADSMEDTESLKNADILINCTEGTATFDIFTYTTDQMRKVGIPENRIAIYQKDINQIKDGEYAAPEFVEPLRKLAQQDFLDSYLEMNNYYRMLCGLPDIGDYGIPVRDYEYLMDDFGGNIWGATYIHELGTEGANLLNDYGILDQIKADYPDADYLDYITCGITPYKARKAYEFQMLYTPTIDNNEIRDQFIRKYEENRLFVMSTYYSDAYKYNSDYYSNFIGLLIMILTMTDMLSKVQGNMVRKDLLDQRCVEYLFEQYGMPYYKTIPLKYQQRICKNLNTLIKEKSCAQGMFDIVNLFGAEDISIFRYFILKDRKINSWGELMYNELVTKTSEYNEWVTHKREEVNGITDLTIPFPVENFLPKGNVMVVWLKMQDGSYKRLEEGKDYSVNNYNTLVFSSTDVTTGATGIRYDFYWDIRTEKSDEQEPDPTNAVTIVINTIKIRKNIFLFQLPYNSYLIDDNDLIVCVSGEILNKDYYEIDPVAKTITLDPSFDVKTERDVFLIFMYGKNLVCKFTRTDLTVGKVAQSTFDVPVPFFNYIQKGNSFFVTIGSTFIGSDRYTTNENTITFKDPIESGRKITFNFIYSKVSVYTDIQIYNKREVIVATKKYQTEFKIHPPYERYMKTGYKVYVKLKNQGYLEQDWYDVFYDTIALRTKAIGLMPDEEITVDYVYGPDNSGADNNVVCKSQHITATSDDITVFSNIAFPNENFFTQKGKVIIDVQGKYLSEDKYTINDSTKILTLKDKNDSPSKGQVVNILFIYQKESEKAIKIQENVLPIEKDGQEEFGLTLPFFPYFETGQSVIILYQTLVVNPNNITFHPTSVTIKNMDFKKGHNLVFLYVFNNTYLTASKSKLVVEDRTFNTSEVVDNDLILHITPPFTDFFDNMWPYYVSDTNKWVDENTYEIVNNGLTFIKSPDILKHDELTFTFIYLNGDKYIHEKYEEDDERDFDLRFIGVPLEDPFFTKNIMAKQNVLPYDTTTLEDVFWDGVGAQDDIESAHLAIKRRILAKKFNYERTKYFGLNYVIDIADMSFQIAYFYNILYDDVFTEDLLNLTIPELTQGKKFNIAHLFCYMTALAYLYSGVEDTIMETPTKILYVKGFNMKADLEALKKSILDERQKTEDYPVWDFLAPTSQMPDMEYFLKVYNTNKSVYQTIVQGMHNAGKYRIYKLWKMLYDSLMIWQFNLKFFRLKDGTVAKSFTEFLQEKDGFLATDIKKISAIQDNDTMRETIANRISNIVYILEDYFGGYEFHHIFDRLPGVSETALMDYIYLIISFFKSYKVVLRSKGDYITFSSKDPNLNSLRPVDDAYLKINLNKPEYIYLKEVRSPAMYTNKKDSLGFTDRAIITTSTTGTGGGGLGPGSKVHITISKYDHQIIYVYANDQIHTEDFDLNYGDEFFCSVKAKDEGYNPGRLNITNGIALKDETITATEPSPVLVDIIINQEPHQTIVVTYEKKEYTSSFQVPKGSYISARSDPDYGYNEGTISFIGGKVYSDTVITVTDAVMKICRYKIKVSAHQKFTIEFGDGTRVKIDGGNSGQQYPSTGDLIQIPFGTKYKVTITPYEGYTKGSLTNGIPETGVFEEPQTIFEVSDSKLQEYTITVIQKPNQTITVTAGDTDYTRTFTARYGTLYKVTIKADETYTAGKLSITEDSSGNKLNTSGVVRSNMTVTATAEATPTPKLTITVIQSPHQNITVTCKGVEYTSTFQEYAGVTWSTRIEAENEHYTAGEIVNASGYLVRDTTIYATAAIPEQFTMTIMKYTHQHIQATTYNSVYTSTSLIDYGTDYTVDVIPDIGWMAGKPNIAFGTVTGNFTLSASESTQEKRTIYCTIKEHQKIIVTSGGKTFTNQKEIVLTYGDEYTINVVGDEGYNVGTAKITDIDGGAVDSIGRITKDIYVDSVGNPSIMRLTIHVQNNPHCTVSYVVDGTTYTTDHTFDYGTKYTPKYTTDDASIWEARAEVRLQAQQNNDVDSSGNYIKPFNVVTDYTLKKDVYIIGIASIYNQYPMK